MSKIAPLVSPRMLSHGTVECADIANTRRFYEEFLGIDVIRPLPEAQYIWKGGPWTVVCVHVDGEAKDQGMQNRFELALENAAAVDAAHAAANERAGEYGIRQVLALNTRDGVRSFLLQDLDKVWWEISDISQAHFDAAFARGDVAA